MYLVGLVNSCCHAQVPVAAESYTPAVSLTFDPLPVILMSVLLECDRDDLLFVAGYSCCCTAVLRTLYEAEARGQTWGYFQG